MKNDCLKILTDIHGSSAANDLTFHYFFFLVLTLNSCCLRKKLKIVSGGDGDALCFPFYQMLFLNTLDSAMKCYLVKIMTPVSQRTVAPWIFNGILTQASPRALIFFWFALVDLKVQPASHAAQEEARGWWILICVRHIRVSEYSDVCLRICSCKSEIFQIPKYNLGETHAFALVQFKEKCVIY